MYADDAVHSSLVSYYEGQDVALYSAIEIFGDYILVHFSVNGKHFRKFFRHKHGWLVINHDC